MPLSLNQMSKSWIIFGHWEGQSQPQLFASFLSSPNHTVDGNMTWSSPGCGFLLCLLLSFSPTGNRTRKALEAGCDTLCRGWFPDGNRERQLHFGHWFPDFFFQLMAWPRPGLNFIGAMIGRAGPGGKALRIVAAVSDLSEPLPPGKTKTSGARTTKRALPRFDGSSSIQRHRLLSRPRARSAVSCMEKCQGSACCKAMCPQSTLCWWPWCSWTVIRAPDLHQVLRLPAASTRRQGKGAAMELQQLHLQGFMPAHVCSPCVPSTPAI